MRPQITKLKMQGTRAKAIYEIHERYRASFLDWPMSEQDNLTMAKEGAVMSELETRLGLPTEVDVDLFWRR